LRNRGSESNFGRYSLLATRYSLFATSYELRVTS
jgi:hypothetical protein